jgi:uncharacterized protein (TIGR03382 family)
MKSLTYKHGIFLLCLPWLAIVGSIRPAAAVVMYNITFNDPGKQFVGFYDAITTNAVAAGAAWGAHLAGDASIEVEISFDPAIPTAAGASVIAAFVGTSNGLNIFEQGAAAEVRTGIDPNGAAPDAMITLGTDYVVDDLWFDREPTLRTASIADGRVDAYSVFLHEFGHVYAFNGFRDPFTGLLPADYASPYDANVVFDGENFFFVGAAATTVYGGLVPLTYGTYAHVANAFPRPGSDLILDLMNGVVFSRETRYEISPLDLAIFSDVGLPVLSATPEPSTISLWAVGGLWLLLLVARRRSRR